MTQVMIYNLGGTEVLGYVSLKHAVTMLHRQVATVRDAVPGQKFGPHPRPRAVELVRYVYAKWRYRDALPPTRANVLRRDRNRCAYCGGRADTLDHVRPRCQNGRDRWDNLVAACHVCNGSKGGRTPEQAGMRLLWIPYRPTPEQLFLQR